MAKAFAGASLAVALSVSVLVVHTPPASGQAAAAAPVVKDQGEYDALTAAQNEKDPVKKADLLKVWADKYPDSQFKNQRMLMMVQTWNMIAASTMQSTPSADKLAQGKAAAQSLVDNIDAAFSPDMKPKAGVSDDQWAGARKQVEETAHMVLAFVAQQAKDYPTAEAEYKKVLVVDDQNAQAAYQLGASIISEHKVDRTPEALYELARAVGISGPMALGSPEPKATIDAYLARSWKGYHGDDPQGLKDLKAMAAKSALPPDDIDKTIESVVDIEKKKFANEEDYLKAHPDIKLWRDLKATLTAADGDDYFSKSMKGAIVPQEFTAKVVSWSPEASPSEIRISIDDPKGDAVIKYEKPVKTTLVAGQEIKIKGYAEAFAKDPFSLTFKGEESEITGITIEKPAVKKPVVHHRPAAKKT